MGDRPSQSAETRASRHDGFLLIWVLLFLSFLEPLVAVGLTRSQTELLASERLVENEEAFQLAEAGVDHALAVLKTSSVQWNDELAGVAGPDGIVGTADDISFIPPVTSSTGTYDVRLFDNTDEQPPTPDNPSQDVDGVIRIVSTGTVKQSQRRIEVNLWALFNYAIAAQIDIVLRQSSALGNIHANNNILVDQPSTLFGCSQATATGIVDQSKASLTYDPLCGAAKSGVPPITFIRPDETVLRAAVKPWNWNLPNITGTIVLPDQEVAGYNVPLDLLPNTPQTIKFSGGATGPSTMVVFDGYSLRVRDRIGTFKKIGGNDVCTTPLNLNILALGGGSVIFEQPVCLRGLIWAEGNITIAQGSIISGAIVSAAGTIDIKQGSSITFNRNVIQSSLIPGFSGATVLSWQEE